MVLANGGERNEDLLSTYGAIAQAAPLSRARMSSRCGTLWSGSQRGRGRVGKSAGDTVERNATPGSRITSAQPLSPSTAPSRRQCGSALRRRLSHKLRAESGAVTPDPRSQLKDRTLRCLSIACSPSHCFPQRRKACTSSTRWACRAESDWLPSPSLT